MLNASAPKGVYGHLPMRPDLFRFVQWRENLTPDQPLLIPGKGFFAKYLAEMIDLCKSLYFPGAIRMAPEHPEFTCKLRFLAEPGLIDSTFFEFADRVALAFNNIAYQALLEDEVRFVQISTAFDPSLDAKDALEQYRTMTGIDDLRESDADIKAVYRLRLHRGQVKPKPRKAAV